jgi:hypothetical protein
MSIKTGIWIDKRKAIVIRLKGNESIVSTIDSNIETRERIAGESKSFSRFGEQYTRPEKQNENRIKEQTTIFLKEVMDSVQDSNEVVVWGPSKMKYELEKAIQSNRNFSPTLKGVETADNMTENQMVAWVKNYFQQVST